MTQQELVALRDLLDLALRLPAGLRSQVGAWLAPNRSCAIAIRSARLAA